MLSVLTPPQTTGLTTLARVNAELGLTTGADATRDAYLAQAIAHASDLLQREGGRALARRQVKELLAGEDSTSLLLQVTPVVQIDAVTFRGDPIVNTPDDDYAYFLEDADAGIVFRQEGWIDSSAIGVGITRDPLPGLRRPDYALTYWGGYLLPGDNVPASGMTIAGSAKTISRSAGVWPLLVKGDIVSLDGWPSNSGHKTIASRTDDVLTVDEALADDTGTAASVVTVETMPPAADRLAVQVVKAWYLIAGEFDPSIQSERLGDWQATYRRDNQLPAELRDQWIRLFGRTV